MAYWQWSTICSNGLGVQATSPAEFVVHLYATSPSEDPMFAHGDLTDSNLLVDAYDKIYFIDWGRGGVADRRMDRAFIYQNLRKEVSAPLASAFLDRLGEADNPGKRAFFEQLDELF